MKLSEFFEKTGASRKVFASELGVTEGMVWQWIHSYRPVAARHCKGIVSLTLGQVSLRDLRPNDWRDYWPEPSESPFAEDVKKLTMDGSP